MDFKTCRPKNNKSAAGRPDEPNALKNKRISDSRRVIKTKTANACEHNNKPSPRMYHGAQPQAIVRRYDQSRSRPCGNPGHSGKSTPTFNAAFGPATGTWGRKAGGESADKRNQARVPAYVSFGDIVNCQFLHNNKLVPCRTIIICDTGREKCSPWEKLRSIAVFSVMTASIFHT